MLRAMCCYLKEGSRKKSEGGRKKERERIRKFALMPWSIQIYCWSFSPTLVNQKECVVFGPSCASEGEIYVSRHRPELIIILTKGFDA